MMVKRPCSEADVLMVQDMLVFAGVLAMPLRAYSQGDAAAGEKSSSIAPPATRSSRAKRSGTKPGYNYSSAMKGVNITCHEKTLDEYLQGPGRFVLGTSMGLFRAERERPAGGHRGQQDFGVPDWIIPSTVLSRQILHLSENCITNIAGADREKTEARIQPNGEFAADSLYI